MKNQILLFAIFLWLVSLVICGAVACGQTEIEYEPSEVPRYYQSIITCPDTGTNWWPKHRWHGPQSEGRLSNPNLHQRWLGPAGTHGMGFVRAKRKIIVPEGKFVEVWKERRTVNPGGSWNYPLYRWEFPLGTVFREELQTAEGQLFAEREREKITATEWEGHENILFEPPGYERVTLNCSDCHNEAGLRATQLTGHFPGREWYGHMSGGDTSFTFRPVTTTGQIHGKFRTIVRFRRTPVRNALRATGRAVSRLPVVRRLNNT